MQLAPSPKQPRLTVLDSMHNLSMDSYGTNKLPKIKLFFFKFDSAQILYRITAIMEELQPKEVTRDQKYPTDHHRTLQHRANTVTVTVLLTICSSLSSALEQPQLKASTQMQPTN